MSNESNQGQQREHHSEVRGQARGFFVDLPQDTAPLEERVRACRQRIQALLAIVNAIDIRDKRFEQIVEALVVEVGKVSAFVERLGSTEKEGVSKHISSMGALQVSLQGVLAVWQEASSLLKDAHTLELVEKVEAMRLVLRCFSSSRAYLFEAWRLIAENFQVGREGEVASTNRPLFLFYSNDSAILKALKVELESWLAARGYQMELGNDGVLRISADNESNG